MELHKKYKTILDNAKINTPIRLAHFFAQIENESNLKPISENLNYSAKGLLSTFKKYFTEEQAKDYANKPERIANRVYGGRMGNGGERSGDGWLYRGRGFIQITGRNNYKALSFATGINYLKDPDLLLNEADSMISAIWYWSTCGANKFADKDDITTITKLVNGGTIGLANRTKLLKKHKKFFEVK